MKGLAIFGVLLALIFPLYNVQGKDVFYVEGVSEVYFVKAKNGEQSYILQEKKEFDQCELNEIEGLILVFQDQKIDEVVSNFKLKVVKEEMIDDIRIVYGYSDLYSDFIYIDEKQVNVQLAQNDGKTIAGLPLIFSGF